MNLLETISVSSFYITIILAVAVVGVLLAYLRKRKLSSKGSQTRLDQKFRQPNSPQDETPELPMALRDENRPTPRNRNEPETFSSTMLELIRNRHYLVEMEGADKRSRTAIDLGGGAKVKIKSIKPNPNKPNTEEESEEDEGDNY